MTNHSEYGELSTDDKKGKLSVLRKDLKHSTSIFCKSNNENDASNEINFKISLILAYILFADIHRSPLALTWKSTMSGLGTKR